MYNKKKMINSIYNCINKIQVKSIDRVTLLRPHYIEEENFIKKLFKFTYLIYLYTHCHIVFNECVRIYRKHCTLHRIHVFFPFFNYYFTHENYTKILIS